MAKIVKLAIQIKTADLPVGSKKLEFVTETSRKFAYRGNRFFHRFAGRDFEQNRRFAGRLLVRQQFCSTPNNHREETNLIFN